MSMMFNIFRALAVVLSEVLPLSGNGTERLLSVVGSAVEGAQNGMCPIIMAELGAITALVLKLKDRIFFHKDELVTGIKQIRNRKNPIANGEKKETLMLICAVMPMFLWHFLRVLFAPVYKNPLTMVLGFILSGVALIVTDMVYEESCPENIPGMKDSAMAGAFRLIGFIPGMSGSSGMLLAGSLCGFSREYTYELAMFTCIPLFALKILMQLKNGILFPTGLSDAIGCIVCFGFSLIAVFILYDVIKKLYVGRKLRIFSAVLFVLALTSFIYH